MSDLHALGLAGGAGRVDDVCAGVGSDDRRRCGQTCPLAHQVVDVDGRHGAGQLREELVTDGRGVGDDQVDGGVGDDVGQALHRVRRIQREIARTRLEHTENGDGEVDGACRRDSDEIPRDDAALDQRCGDRRRPGVEFAVVERLSTRGDRGPILVCAYGFGEQVDQAQVRAWRVRRRRRKRGERRLLVIRQQHDVADRQARIGGAAVEHPDEPVGDRVNRRGIEKICRIDDLCRPRLTFGSVGDTEGEVDLGRGVLRRDGRDLHSGNMCGVQFCRELRQHRLMEREQHLRQGRERLRPHGVETIDHRFERHVGVRERVEVGGPHRLEQIGERRAGVHVAAEHERVHEHADQRVEITLSATGNRGSHCDIGRGGQSRQQRSECRMHDHERRHTVLARHRRHTACDGGRYREPDLPAPLGGDEGSRTVGRQFQHIRYACQRVLPVGQLTRDHRCRIVGPSEDLVLPDGHVGELHRHRREVRYRARRARRVRRHHVADQRAHRFAVSGDVMGHQREHILVLRGLPDAAAQRLLDTDVEAVGHRGLELCRGVDDAPIEPIRHGVDGADDLYRNTVDRGEHRPQHLVSLDDVDDGCPQRGHVDVAAESKQHRDVIGAQRGIELVDDPHPGLRERQRNAGRTGHDRHDRGKARLTLRRKRGETAHGWLLEDVAHGDVGVEEFGDPRSNASGRQRVAAEVEVALRDTDGLATEHLGVDAGDPLLRVGRRRDAAVLLCLFGRRRQRGDVDLASGRVR